MTLALIAASNAGRRFAVRSTFAGTTALAYVGIGIVILLTGVTYFYKLEVTIADLV